MDDRDTQEDTPTEYKMNKEAGSNRITGIRRPVVNLKRYSTCNIEKRKYGIIRMKKKKKNTQEEINEESGGKMLK
jgi:hypothetical protein